MNKTTRNLSVAVIKRITTIFLTVTCIATSLHGMNKVKKSGDGDYTITMQWQIKNKDLLQEKIKRKLWDVGENGVKTLKNVPKSTFTDLQIGLNNSDEAPFCIIELKLPLSFPLIKLTIEPTNENTPLKLDQDCINCIPATSLSLKNVEFKNCIFTVRKPDFSKFKNLDKITFDSCKIRDSRIRTFLKTICPCLCGPNCCNSKILYPSHTQLKVDLISTEQEAFLRLENSLSQEQELSKQEPSDDHYTSDTVTILEEDKKLSNKPGNITFVEE